MRRIAPWGIALALLAGGTTSLAGQATVGVTVLVTQPNPYLADWEVLPGIATLIVSNPTGADLAVTTTARLVGGGRTGGTLGSAGSDVTTIPGLPSSVFPNTQMARWSELKPGGSVGAQLSRTGRLPEGTYQLCVDFTNITQAGRPLPNATGCGSFTIAFPQPPTLVAPLNGSTVASPYPTFQWTPVITPGVPQVDYLLRVVEIIPGQTPLQALTANLPVLEQALTSVTAMVYPTSALPLESGKSYAWRVQAVRSFQGETGNVEPVGSNQGLSEIYTFSPKAQPGPPNIVTLPNIVSLPPAGGGEKFAGFPLFNSVLTGTLKYSFSPGHVPQPQKVPGLLDFTVPIYPTWENPPPPGFQLPVAGGTTPPQQVGTAVGPPGPDPAPLANVTVRLVVRYRTAKQPVLWNPVHAGGVTYQDAGKVIATTTTDANGHFAFAYHDDNPTGVLTFNSALSWGSGDVAHGSETGSLTRYYNLEVGDGHYLNPSDELVLGANHQGDAGTLVALVRSYRTVVKVVKSQAPTQVLPAITVQLLRGVRPPGVPVNEGPSPAWPRPTLTAGIPGYSYLSLPSWEVLGQAETNAQGIVTFGRLVKNLGPADQYHIRVSVPAGGLDYYQTALVSYAESWPMLGPQGDQAYFNEQYGMTKSDTLLIKLVPQQPRFSGRLIREDTKLPIQGGRADLCRPGSCATRFSDSTGAFSFSNLVPGTYRLDLSAQGFEPESVDNLAFALGQQKSGQYALHPDAHVKGTVIDEDKQPAYAEVQVDGGPWTGTVPIYGTPAGQPVGYQLYPGFFQFGPVGQPASGGQNQPVSAQAILPQPPPPPGTATFKGPLHITAFVFDLDAVSGKQHLRIDGGPDFFPLDTLLTIPKGGPTNLGPFTLHRRLHRLRLTVTGGGQPGHVAPAGSIKPVPGAVVTIAGNGVTGTANGQGIVELTWPTPNAADSSVTVSVAPPSGSDFISRSVTLQVPESATWTQATVRLYQGTSIAGRVYAGTGASVPVPGARVSINLGSSTAQLEGYSDAQGNYLIHGVPVATLMVRAAKSSSNFIGDSLSVDAKGPATTGVDFHLTYYQGMDITRLLGFPIEVQALQDLPGGKALLRGAFTDLPSNSAFAPGVGTLGFDSVTVEPDGTPAKHARPTTGQVLLQVNTLPLIPFGNNHYVATQRTTTGLLVRPVSGTTGAVFGPVELNPASFTNVTPAELDQLPAPYLLLPGATGQARTVLASITADSSAGVGPAGYNLGTTTGAPLGFRLYGFKAEANPDQSFLRSDAMHLHATMHTEIQGVNDLAIQVPDLVVIPGPAPAGGIKAISDSQAISAKLGLWTLQASTWYLNPGLGKLYLSQGQILVPPDPTKPNATIAFPFVGMTVTPTALSGGVFGTGPVQLAGIVPLTATNPIAFAMEGPGGPWSLTALGGSIPALPGMDPGSSIPIDNFSFRSDGTGIVTPATQASVRFYNTADFAVKAIGVTQTSVQLGGNLDVHVPNLAPASFNLTYSKSGSATVLVLPPLTFPAFDIGGASLTLKNGTLSPAGFKSAGSLDVPGKWSVPVDFARTPLSTNQISATPAAGATLTLGQIVVNQLTGGPKVTNGTWGTHLDGHLDVNNGEASGPISFTVATNDVTVGTSGLTVKNISTPFGDIAVTLNYPQRRLEGSLQLQNTQLAQGATANGAAELAISGLPTNRYWYFFAGADVQVQSPKLGLQAALVIGDATLPDSLIQKFGDYSNQGLPAGFETVNGFFFDGKITIPVTFCPNTNVDVGVGGVKVWCDVWGDFRLGMNFQELNTYHVGAEVGAEVGAKGGVGLGVCLHVSGSVSGSGKMEGEYRSDGAWWAAGGFEMTLSGEVSGGIGIDDFCIEGSEGFSGHVSLEGQVGTNWNTGEGPHFTVNIP